MRKGTVLIIIAAALLGLVGQSEAASISGKVTDQKSGLPIRGAKITALTLANGNADSLVYQAFSDSSGRYALTGLVDGAYTLWCEHVNYVTAFRRITVTIDSNLVVVDFQLAPRTGPSENRVAGIVFDSTTNAPIANAEVYLWTKAGANGVTEAIFSTASDTNGRYEFRAFYPPGKYVLLAAASGYQPFQSDTLIVADTTVINLDVPLVPVGNSGPATLTGHVWEASSDTLRIPIAGAEIRLIGFGANRDSLQYRALTDADGKYTIENIPPGIGSVFVTAIGYLGQSVNLLALSSGVTTLDFYLVKKSSIPNGFIAGKVFFEATGLPISDAIINVLSVQGVHNAITFTDTSGEYSVQVPEGNYVVNCRIFIDSLFAYEEFYDNASLWEQASPVFPGNPLSGINAVLTPIVPDTGSGALAGVVRDANASPLSGVLIIAWNASGKPVGFDLTDGQGTYQIAGFTGGRYTIQATKARFRSQVGEVLYSPNATGTQLANFTLEQATTSVETSKEQEALPVKFELGANYPNPFSPQMRGTFGNPSTTIYFGLPKAQEVRLAVYNVLGREVKNLLTGYVEAGRHNLEWNGTDNAGKPVASGIYFYTLQTSQTRLVRKMVLSK
jgi:hypothetical protein